MQEIRQNLGILFIKLTLTFIISYSYVLRITISRRMADIVKEKPLWVINPNSGSSMISPEHSPLPGSNGNIKMEVGIEDCLHIEFEYNRNK